MNKKSKFKHFVLYGSQSSEKHIAHYRCLLLKIENSSPTPQLKYHLTTPQNLTEKLYSLNEPAYFFPLFLMEGVEYTGFAKNIKNNFLFENIISRPLEKYPEFLKLIFNGNINSVFLMHGSNRYDNLIKHKEIINFGESLGYKKYCFLEGIPFYKNYIKEELQKQALVEITPIFFNKGKHIEIDLIDKFLNNYPQEKWQVNSCLLEREDIINAIVKIVKKGLE